MELERSTDVVRRFLSDPTNYESKQKCRNPSKLTTTTRRTIIRGVSQDNLSSAKIVKALQLSVKARCVSQIFSSVPHLHYSINELHAHQP